MTFSLRGSASTGGLVKIDVEGAEPDVLAGIRRTMARYRTTVIVEIWKRNLDSLRALTWSWDTQLSMSPPKA